MSEQLTLADVVGVYGVKGWVKIRPYIEDPATLPQLQGVTLAPGPKLKPGVAKSVEVVSVKAQGKGYVACLRGVDDRTDAEALRGWVLQMDPSFLPEAGDDEYYWRDLIGLTVICRDGEQEAVLGRVDYLLETGANDVLVIKPTEDSVDDREHLVPWILGDVVRSVDVEQGVINVDWYFDA